MMTGIVSGNLFSTINHSFYDGKKLLFVEKTGVEGTPTGETLIAIDGGVGAGIGDAVLILDEGTGARQIVGDAAAPLRAIIVGIVDRMDVEH